MKRFLLIVMISSSAAGLYAQSTSCAQNLRLARATYDQGRLHEVPQYLQSCIQSSVTQERVDAYKLLCLTYIYLEEPQKADEAMLNLLRTNNYFEVNPAADPAEFVALYRTFRTDPIYRIGVKIGANATMPNVISYVPANDLPSEYDYNFAFQGGLAADIPLKLLKNKLTLHPELLFLMKSFKYTSEGTRTDQSPEGEPFDRKFETNGIEKHTWVSLPISLQYQLSDSRIKPYVALGVSTDYLLGARNIFSRTKEDATSLDEQSEDIKDSRNKINVSAIASAGIKVKVTGGFAIAEIRYVHGITKINDVESIYTNFDRIYPTNGYVNGIFKINSLSVTIGYVYNRFNPKKLKR